MSKNQMDPVDLERLFVRYLRNEYSVADFNALQRHFDTQASQEQLQKLVLSALEEQAQAPTEQQGELGDVHENLRIGRVVARLDTRIAGSFTDHKIKKPIRFGLWQRIAAAAVLVLAVAGSWAYFGNLLPAGAVDIPPGGNRATLTLVDGRTVELSSAYEGIVIGEEDIRYLDGRNITYVVQDLDFRGKTDGTTGHIDANSSPGSPFMAITTPRGGTYQLTLPDGSRVWLNAATTLRYPARFDGQERIVELEGEAYFDVSGRRTHQDGTPQPFIVKSRDQTVEVLGTQFNVHAYPESEFTKTTLVEGSVRVASGGDAPGAATHTLKPQQQSIVPATGGNVVVIDIDPEAPIAWKDKFFRFDQERLADIMVEVARWYDVEVEYTNPALKNKVFSGSVSRFENVSQLLSKLELTGSVQFKIEERRIVVME